MKNLKILFFSFLLVAFIAPNVSNAQSEAEWLIPHNVTITIDGDNYKLVSEKHRVITANGIINFVAFGEAVTTSGMMVEPGEYTNPTGAKITVYPDGTFKAVKHDKSKKKTPANK